MENEIKTVSGGRDSISPSLIVTHAWNSYFTQATGQYFHATWLGGMYPIRGHYLILPVKIVLKIIVESLPMCDINSILI